MYDVVCCYTIAAIFLFYFFRGLVSDWESPCDDGTMKRKRYLQVEPWVGTFFDDGDVWWVDRPTVNIDWPTKIVVTQSTHCYGLSSQSADGFDAWNGEEHNNKHSQCETRGMLFFFVSNFWKWFWPNAWNTSATNAHRLWVCLPVVRKFVGFVWCVGRPAVGESDLPIIMSCLFPRVAFVVDYLGGFAYLISTIITSTLFSTTSSSISRTIHQPS